MHFDDTPVAGLTGHSSKSLEDQNKQYKEQLPFNYEAERLGSRLNDETGQVDPRTVKAVVARDQQFGVVSPAYILGYSNIRWNSNKNR